jgi:hypothetical protein
MPEAQHQGGERDWIPHELRSFGACDAFALAQAIGLFDVLLDPRERRWISNLCTFQMHMQFGGATADDFFVSQQDGRGDLFIEQDLAGSQNFAFPSVKTMRLG